MKLKIALIQSSLTWENPTENRSHLAQKITGFMEDVDLIVLPEMFSSGFTMNPKAVAETMQGETISWLQHLAKAKNCAITGSLVIAENGHFYNRLVFVFPNGEIKTYDKRHLFTLAGEDKVYTAGTEKLIEHFEDGRVELFDLAADPGERSDLSAARPKRAAELARRLSVWRNAVGAVLPTPNPSPVDPFEP